MPPRVAFVTGASSGFGATIARRYARAGVRVVATARRGDRLAGLLDEFGEDLIFVSVLDVRDRIAIERLAASLPPAFAEVDVLVNNAGLALGLEPAQEADLENWKRMIETNCTGLAYVTRALLPGMVQRRRGHVVNLGSIAATYPFAGDTERAAGLYAGTEPLTPEDIAAAVEWVTFQPPHVNVNLIELMPVSQSFGALPVDRSGARP